LFDRLGDQNEIFEKTRAIVKHLHKERAALIFLRDLEVLNTSGRINIPPLIFRSYDEPKQLIRKIEKLYEFQSSLKLELEANTKIVQPLTKNTM